YLPASRSRKRTRNRPPRGSPADRRKRRQPRRMHQPPPARSGRGRTSFGFIGFFHAGGAYPSPCAEAHKTKEMQGELAPPATPYSFERAVCPCALEARSFG